MLRKTSQIGIILCALLLAVSLCVFMGCSKKESAADSSLKGKTVVIGNWWTNWNVDTYEPANEEESRQLDWRKKIQSDNGFTMYEEEISGWDDYLQIITNYILSGNKKYNAYYVGADWAMSLFRQGLLAPLPSDVVKVSGQEPSAARQQTGYGAAMANMFTFGGNQYAMVINRENESWQTVLILYNKRLLREAGIDPETPYNMQRDGTWTWDAFLDMVRRTTRDNNNDGITDVYGLASDDDGDVLSAFVYSNGANLVTFDNSGRAVNSSNSPAYLEALNFFTDLRTQGLMMPKPTDAQWAWNFYNFVDGGTAFFIGQEWFKGMAGDMQDDYGSVLMPKGPRASNYRVSFTDNVMIVPSILTAQEVEDTLKAIDLWYVPMSDDYLAGHYGVYRDRRAVEETVAMTRDSRYITYRNYMLIPGVNDIYKDFISQWHTFTGTPAQLVEQFAPRYNAAIDSFNR
uniref:Extracellular solute-binding protein, family 1 n=1 Tax=uncultured bacterium contig00002 TaxID=1181494 RepID=A0A806KBH0_9BACT|nr:extracellular solute-binding protein, family 1 [uncultured bacterium contig00002]